MKKEDPDTLYRHDLSLKKKAEEISQALSDLSTIKDQRGAHKGLLQFLQDLAEIVKHRDEDITEVA